MKQTITSLSHDETFSWAQKLGNNAKPGDIFALDGDLGCGKTVIAQGLASGLGITDPITSPTFNLLEIYEGSLPLYHFDLYRIEDESELDYLYFEEYWEGDGVSVIEWASNARDRIPDTAYSIQLEYIDDHTRRITIEHSDI